MWRPAASAKVCHHAIAQGKQQHTGHRDDGQQHLQLAIGRNDLVHRAQQQRLHFAPDRVQRAGACQQDPLIGVELACGDALAAQQRQRGGGQGAHRHGQHAILAFHQQRHMHRQQLPHFVRQGLADGKPHQHPADHHRRAHGHHDKLVGHAPDHGHTAALRLAGQQRRHLPHGAPKIVCAAGCTERTQVQSGVQQRRHLGADPAAMVLQHRLDGFLVIRVHCRAEPVVGRQQGRALAQLLCVLVKQPPPDVFVGVEFARDLAAGVAVDGGAPLRPVRHARSAAAATCPPAAR